jgi:hypothetical protein
MKRTMTIAAAALALAATVSIQPMYEKKHGPITTLEAITRDPDERPPGRQGYDPSPDDDPECGIYDPSCCAAYSGDEDCFDWAESFSTCIRCDGN